MISAQKKARALEDNTATVYQHRRLKQIAARWDARAETWDRSLRQPKCHLNEDQAYSRFLEQVHRVLQKRQSFCAKGGIIDVGCGTGLVLEQVIPWFAWGIGVDISNKMINLARKKPIPNTRFVVADAFELAGPSAAAILSRGVLLSHYGREEGTELLKSLRRLLVARGFIIIDFLNLAARDRHRHVPDKKTYFTGDEVCQMAQNAGFSRVRILGRMERRVLLLYCCG